MEHPDAAAAAAADDDEEDDDDDGVGVAALHCAISPRQDDVSW